MIRWAILTGEYPPQPGGVSDYTALIARSLATSGDTVQVFAPPSSGPPTHVPGVEVNVLPGHYGPLSLLRLDQLLSAKAPDRILVQYVPHGFGWKAMNLPFVMWIAFRARRIAPVWVVFHEVVFPFSWRPMKHAILGTLTRVMARLLVGAAVRVFVSIPAWGDILKQIQPRSRKSEWLPVPSTLETKALAHESNSLRTRFVPPGTFLVGHFGTFGSLITNILTPSLAELLRLSPNTRILLVGRGSVEYASQFKVTHPESMTRLESTGDLPSDAVSAHLRACDLLLQPFPDGVSSRRTSVMAGLANGVSVVTNLGFLSEPIWTCGAVVVAPSPDPIALAKLTAALLSDASARDDLARRAMALYRDTFALDHTIARLRSAHVVSVAQPRV